MNTIMDQHMPEPPEREDGVHLSQDKNGEIDGVSIIHGRSDFGISTTGEVYVSDDYMKESASLDFSQLGMIEFVTSWLRAVKPELLNPEIKD